MPIVAKGARLLTGFGALVLFAGVQSAQASELNTIAAIHFAHEGASRHIRITGSQRPTFQRFTLRSPFRIVLDFVSSQVADVPDYTEIGDELIDSVGVEQKGVGGTSLCRVMITFVREVDYSISTQGSDVVISIHTETGAAGDVSSPEAEPVHVATATPRKTQAAAKPVRHQQRSEVETRVALADTPRAMNLVGFRYMQDVSRIFIRTNDQVQFTVQKSGNLRLVVELQNTSIPIYNNQRFLDTRYFPSPVKLITPESIEGGSPTVRIDIELKRDTPYNTKQVDNELWIDFPNG